MAIPAIDELPGGDFAAAVMDMHTGEVLASTGSGVFPLDDPDIFMLAYVVEMMNDGVMDLERIVGRDESIADRFRLGLMGNREAAGRAMWIVGLETLNSWVAEKGMSDTELHDIQLLWEGAPVTEPSMSSLADLLADLRIIYSGIEISSVRYILGDPDMGDGQAAGVGEGWTLYGWVDSGEDHKTFALIARSASGRDLGLVLLSDDLCCEEKGDLAMMLLWNAAKEL